MSHRATGGKDARAPLFDLGKKSEEKKIKNVKGAVRSRLSDEAQTPTGEGERLCVRVARQGVRQVWREQHTSPVLEQESLRKIAHG